MELYQQISEKLQKGKAKDVKALVQQAIDEGLPVQEILEKGLMDGMNIIGEKFKKNEVFVPEVLVAARAMNMGASLLKPLLAAEGVKATGRVCIGTVQGDLHDIGKNLVKMMLEGKGLEVVDLGTDVSAETFVNTAKEQNCQIICWIIDFLLSYRFLAVKQPFFRPDSCFLQSERGVFLNFLHCFSIVYSL